MVRQLRGAGVRRDLARDLTRASSPLLVAPLGGVGPSESDGTGPAEGCCLWWSSVWTGTCWRGRGGYRGRSSGRGLEQPRPFFMPLFTQVRREAVWKVVLGGYFATLARMRKRYPTDLSDAEWSYIEPHFPAPKGHGCPRTHDLREILNAVFYVLKSGCPRRLLPHDFPRWPTVYHYFRTWRIE